MDVSLESVPRKCLLYCPSRGRISRSSWLKSWLMASEGQWRSRSSRRLRSLVKARYAISVVASKKGRRETQLRVGCEVYTL
jgi:hypothetical protein